MAQPTDLVQELQGLYGPFTLTERVVQKIWLRQDFDRTGLVLLDGRSLEIKRPGSWNLLAGPDFRSARMVIDGQEVVGDVEVHFREGDWRAHGHESDPAYEEVVLHVVLFPPAARDSLTRTRTGKRLPTLTLLPKLYRGLEEYAADDALENLTARDAAEKLSALARLPAAELKAKLAEKAWTRWAQKQRFARLRIARLGWSAAAHHTALEILGYRCNRATMLAIATRYPLGAWLTGIGPEEIFGEFADAWQVHGIRPANHPLHRLRQYSSWVARVPDWPDRMLQLPPDLLKDQWNSGRRPRMLSTLRCKVAREIAGSSVGGSRFDNLVCDGFLPMLAAHTDWDVGAAWFNWYPGDAPAEVRRGLVALGVAGRGVGPHLHGWAQGLLALILELEADASG